MAEEWLFIVVLLCGLHRGTEGPSTALLGLTLSAILQ